MADQTFFGKLRELFLEAHNDEAVAKVSVPDFLKWVESWLAEHPPVGTGFADGTSAITIRFQDGNQYPLYADLSNTITVGGVQITGQASKAGKGGIVSSPSFPITGK